MNSYTLKEAYLHTKQILKTADIESPTFDAGCLIQHLLGYDKSYIITNGGKEITQQKAAELFALAQKRAEGIPLQYILGKWSFMGLDYFVGEGVLIPREDTSVVIEQACKLLLGKENQTLNILDLCSGSGIIAITLAKRFTNSFVTAVELSDKAFPYLIKNIKYHKVKNIAPVMADVLSCEFLSEDNSFDLIISNPPYIACDEIPMLQKEVLFEPEMALNGGDDGCKFYREIIIRYKSLLKAGGVMAFELGEGQYDYVKKLMLENGFKDIEYRLDLGGCRRSIAGIYDA